MYLESTTAKIYYELHGETGDWVTLVNGHTRTMRDFKIFTRKLVEAGFRVLLLDNRGAGESKVSFPFSLSEMASDVIDLWDEIGIEKVTYLGYQWVG